MIRRWFAAPQHEDEYLAFSLWALHYTLLIIIAIILCFALLTTSPAQLIFLPIALLLFGTCYVLLRSNHYQLASALFIGGFWLVITIASLSINGIRNSSLSGYAIVIIYTAILFSSRQVIIVTGLSILSGAVLYIGEIQGVLPLRTTELFLLDRFAQLMGLFIASGILLSAASRVIRRSVSQSRQHQQALEQRNAQLEQEILERQRVEADLRSSEERYRLLFENASLAAVIYDREGELLLINQSGADLFGKPIAELQGLTVHELFSPEDAGYALAHHHRVMDSRKAEIIEGHTTLPTGREIYYHRHVMPLPSDESGSISQVLVLTADVTERKRAEQQEHALHIANEKNAFFTDFFSTISHDLKTPLTVMKTSLYLLERVANDERRKEKLSQIEEQVDLLDEYIQDMLAISRLEHLPSFRKEAVALQPIIAEVVAQLRPRADHKQIDCQIRQTDILPPIRADADQFRRALVNLVENAINYTPPNGTITVSAEHANEAAVIEVQDTGMGIAAEDLPRIFERFYRTPAARSAEDKGTGLGLAIVKRIIDMHNGTIEVSSELGHGTIFRIRLPA